MSENDLVQNGDFSSGSNGWVLEGLTQNAQVVSEDGNTFMRFGPGVTMSQEIAVTPSREHELAFRFQALWVGNGITIKVIGLDADNRPAQTLAEQGFGQTQSWRDATLSVPASPYAKLRVQFEIASAADLDDVALRASQQLSEPGLRGQYYHGCSFDLLAFERVDGVVDHYWSKSGGPSSGGIALPADNYSIRWTGYLRVPSTVTRRIVLRTISDDGVRLWVYPLNSPKPSPIVDNWQSHPSATADSAPLDLAADTIYHLQIDFYQTMAPGTIRLQFYLEGDDPQSPAPTVPTEWLYAALA